ncbi:MAG: dihydroorotate dehydrogenase electron transfer subunit [Kiritimatiellae bacterium]|nr:dihydroorotate dehydrogenase electron transfer subunit [Kiritimatiellia bacterium]
MYDPKVEGIKLESRDETARVLSIHPVQGEYWLLRAHAPFLAGNAQPGQYVHIRVPGLEASALRRPFSIYGCEGEALEILFKVVGRGSAALSRVQEGDVLQILGPLGNGFPLPKEKAAYPVCVAGGYGVAPFHFFASRVSAGSVLIGGRTAGDILCADSFPDGRWRVGIATEDGSKGTKGLVTRLLKTELETYGSAAVIYACGPDGMLRAVGEMAASFGCTAWLSLDKHMVCGVGACLACVQKIRLADGTERLLRVCKEGPVFEASEIVW